MAFTPEDIVENKQKCMVANIGEQNFMHWYFKVDLCINKEKNNCNFIQVDNVVTYTTTRNVSMTFILSVILVSLRLESVRFSAGRALAPPMVPQRKSNEKDGALTLSHTGCRHQAVTQRSLNKWTNISPSVAPSHSCIWMKCKRPWQIHKYSTS